MKCKKTNSCIVFETVFQVQNYTAFFEYVILSLSNNFLCNYVL